MAATLSTRQRLLAYGLTGTAGYVDGLAFIHLGGFFVSFMTGNSTRAGVELANGNLPGWMLATSLLVSFVIGVMLAAVMTRMVDAHEAKVPSPDHIAPVQAAVWLGFGLMLASAVVGSLWPEALATALLLAGSMGAINGTFTREGQVAVGLTYMTGTLVKIGQSAVTALATRRRKDFMVWLQLLSLWLSIAVGAIIGAFLYLRLGVASIWLAAISMGLMASTVWATKWRRVRRVQVRRRR